MPVTSPLSPGTCETLLTPSSPQAPHLPQRRLFLCLFNRGGGRGWFYLPLFFLLKNILPPGGSRLPAPCTELPRPLPVYSPQTLYSLTFFCK